jgi:Tfp pilus assembly protein PilN
MPNGKNNKSGRKEIELLPEELRRPEEKKKREEKREVKLFVPPEFIPPKEEKLKGPKFWEKIFGTREERDKKRKEKEAKRAGEIKKQQEEKARLELLKMKAAEKPQVMAAPPKPQFQKPSPLPPPPSPPAARPAPKILTGVKPLRPEAAAPAKKKFGITLMPTELAAAPEIRRTKQMTILMIVILILGAVLGGSYGILRWYEEKVAADLKKVETDLMAANQQIKNLDEKKNQAQILQKQLKVVDKLLDQHLHWTNLFAFLEENTIPDVYFLNLVGASDGQITMSAAAKSYKDIAQQIIAFRENERVEKVSITSASASVDPEGLIIEVDFDAKLKLKPEIFLK